MSLADVKRILERTPFSPFRIHLSNGQSFEIHHPEFVWLFPTRMLIAVPSKEPRVMEHEEQISLLHIARIEQLPVAA
jgi:hypothetical protein